MTKGYTREEKGIVKVKHRVNNEGLGFNGLEEASKSFD
jgi:hypothetical protein